MAGLLVDTDVFVDHLRGHRPLTAEAGRAIAYSVITRAELHAGPADQLERVRALLAAFRELGVGGEVAELAGRIRRERGLLLPDALIAATAISHELELLTRNRRDFARVEGLRLAEPEA